MLEIKTTSVGRQPQNIKSGIIQKPLPQVLNLSGWDQTKLEMKTISNWRWPQNIKVETTDLILLNFEHNPLGAPRNHDSYFIGNS